MPTQIYIGILVFNMNTKVLIFNVKRSNFLLVFYDIQRTQWWLNVVKHTFINAGVDDKPNLDATSWHLIKLYGTAAGWEVVPGTMCV